jgi:hypothetical protein
MTIEQQKAFINALGGQDYELLYLTYLYTGCRRNEVKNDLYVDFDNDSISISLY